MSDVMVQAVEHVVSAVTPEMTEDWHIFALHLKWEGEDNWSITRYHQYLGRDGTYSWRNMADEEWWNSHVFDWETAVALASKWCPEIRVNGHHAQKVADRWHADQHTKLSEELQPNG